MEKELRISYLILYPIIALLLFFILKSEGGMAMGFFIIFINASIPFLLLNIGRSCSRIRKVLFYLNITYLISLAILSFAFMGAEGCSL